MFFLFFRQNGSNETDRNHSKIPPTTSLETLPGFDFDAGASWIYPINFPIREYQYNIVKEALFENILVSLPTGYLLI